MAVKFHNAEFEEQASTPSTPASGRRKLYPTADGWFDLDDAGNVTALIDDLLAVYNNSGGNIATEKVVYISGHNSGQDLPEISEADANAGGGAELAIGITQAAINNGASGVIRTRGIATYPTTGLSVGDALYVSETAGDLTDTAPTTSVFFGKVIKVGGTGTGLIYVNPDSAVAVTGAATTAEIMLTAGGGSSPTTNGAATGSIETTTNAVLVPTLDFDASTDEYAQWAVTMPSNWDAGTVTAKFYWSAASGSGDVVWGLQAVSFANDDALDAAFGTAQTVTDTLTAIEDLCVTAATSAITIAGSPAAGDLVVFRAYRDADAGGDTLAVDAQLISVQVTYNLT